MNTSPTAKKALAAIEFFEGEGREITGVSINGREYRLDFATNKNPDVPQVDLVTMGK